MRPLILLLLLPLVAWNGPSFAQDGDAVRIGVLAKRGAEHTLIRWQATADYLGEKIPAYRFEIVPLDFSVIDPAVAAGKIDFVLANSGLYVDFEMRYGASRIATLRNADTAHGYGHTLFGGVIFTRRERSDIDSLEALRGQRLAAVEENSLGGFQMAWRELNAIGLDPHQDTRLRFVGTHDAVVYAVLEGKADVGTVRTDTLERMAAEGKLDLGELRVIHPQTEPGFDFMLSTRLYPEWPIARLAKTSEELAHAVATALLEMPPDSTAAREGRVAGWVVPRNYQPVHELLRELRIGPYADLGRITPEQLVHQYGRWLLLTLLLILVMAGVILYVSRLNRRLRLAEARLMDAHDHLAERVRERTAELEASRAQLERISRDWNDAFDAVDDPIFIHDAEMRLVQANPAYCRRAGAALEELLGKPYFEYFPKRQDPLPSCRKFPETLRQHGDELHLESGEIYISRSFGIERSDGEIRHALHILEDVTAEREAQGQLTKRIELEGLLAHLASMFVAVEPEGLDQAICEALARLGGFTAADRVYLFQYVAGDDTIDNTHEWCAEGVRSAKPQLQGQPFERFPWLKRKLLRGEVVIVDDVSHLPAAAAAERAEFEREAIRSLLLTPLRYGGRFVGFVGFDFVARGHGWQELDIRLLGTAGELIANTLGRISAVQRLRRSEASLTAAQQIAHLGNWDWNILTGELAWSDEIYRIFGLQPQEFQATYEAFLERVLEEDRAYVSAEVNRAVAGESAYEIDHRIRLPDGALRMVHEKGDVQRDAEGRAVRMIGTVQDVTEARRSEQELRRLNRALRTLSRCNTTLVHAENEPALLQAICSALVETGGYCFAWVGFAEEDSARSIRPVAHAGGDNGFLETLHASWGEGPAGELPPGFAIRRRAPFIERDLASGQGAETWRAAALERGYVSVIALPLICQEELFGALTIDAAEPDAFDENELALLLELAGDLAFGIHTLRSREERKRTEAALAATEERYKELYENAPNGYLSASAVDGQLLQFNRSLCEMLGYTREALEGKRVFDLYAPGDEGQGKARALFERFKQGEVIRDVQLQMRRREGETVWVSISVDPVFDEAGRVRESRSMVVDISARKRAEREQEEARGRLQRSLVQTIQAIALTIEKRDPYTAGHQEQVARIAVAIAEEMGLDPERIEGLRLGALIHDIGKIAVPAEILSRPGKLSPELFAVIKSHPTVGHEIIEGIEFPWPLAEMVLQHHERLDGSGYPQGLKGDEIRLEARILGVADVVEAIASHRPYRPALGVDAAMQVLEEGRGTLFDPQVIDSCLGVCHGQNDEWSFAGRAKG